MELAKKVLFGRTPNPSFSGQHVIISSDGRIAVSSLKDITIFSFDDHQNIKIIGSIRIENKDTDTDTDNEMDIDTTTTTTTTPNQEFLSFSGASDGTTIVNVSWVSDVDIVRNNNNNNNSNEILLTVLLSNGLLLLFQTNQHHTTLEMLADSNNLLIHLLNMKLTVNVTTELKKLLLSSSSSKNEKSVLNSDNNKISAFEWSTIQSQISSQHKYLTLASQRYIFVLDVFVDVNFVFRFELKCQFDCSTQFQSHRAPCRQLQYYFNKTGVVSSSSSSGVLVGYLFLVMEKSVVRMKVIIRNENNQLEFDKEWQCEERFDTMMVLDQNTLCLSSGMDIFLLSDTENSFRYVKLQRIHTSNITSLFLLMHAEGNGQQTSLSTNSIFASSSVGGECFSWCIAEEEIADVRALAPDPLKSLGLACDPLGAILVSLRCVPPRLIDSKLTQGACVHIYHFITSYSYSYYDDVHIHMHI